jgi:hypothetical protein
VKDLWHHLTTRALAPVGSVFSLLHTERVINRRAWIIYTAILCGLLVLHVPFLIETRPFLAFLVAMLVADLAGGVFHIYCDHTAIRNDGSLLDDQRKGFQWHHENPNGKFEDPAYEPHYEMNYVYPYAILGTVVSFGLPGQFRAFALFFSVFSVLQQASHLWCHARLSGRCVPLLVAWLQDARVLLHPSAHQKHHTDPNFDGNFCIFTGHTNALVNVGWLAVRRWQGRAR